MDSSERIQAHAPPGAQHAGQAAQRAAQTTFWPGYEGAVAERRAKLRGALAALELQRRVAEDLERIVLYLDACSGERGCRARVEVIAAGLAIPKRSLQRRLALLAERGLIRVVTNTHADGSQAPSERIVCWGTVGQLARSNHHHAARPARRPEPSAQRSGARAGQYPPAGGASLFAESGVTVQSGTPPRQTVTPPCQSGTPVFKKKKDNTSPTLNSNSTFPMEVAPHATLEGQPAVGPPPSARTPGWGGVGEELSKLGLRDALRAVQEARQQGLTPQAALEIIRHWSGSRIVRKATGEIAASAYGLGALHARLRLAVPGVPASEGWPEPRPAFLKLQAEIAARSAATGQEVSRG